MEQKNNLITSENKLMQAAISLFIGLSFFTAVVLILLMTSCGTTRTETYQADFEKKQSIETVSDYDGKPISVQVLSIGISENVLNSYPVLKEKNVGLGVTNITLDYRDWETDRKSVV